jgi:hypothetical protein
MASCQEDYSACLLHEWYVNPLDCIFRSIFFFGIVRFWITFIGFWVLFGWSTTYISPTRVGRVSVVLFSIPFLLI